MMETIMKLIIALLTCFSFARSQYTDTCPFSEKIKPCYCDYGTHDRPFIVCERLNSAEELAKVIKSMNGYFMKSFIIKKSNIGVLPSDVFLGMEIEELVIKDCNLTKLGDSPSSPPFLGLEKSLLSLKIRRSFTNENYPLKDLSLSHLKLLETLYLFDNLISTIGNNWFENGPYNIKDLRFKGVNIENIGSHAFETLERLQYIKFEKCSLTGISRDVFPENAEFLVEINLTGNKLKSLPSNIFTKMPSLRKISLNDNSLTTIDEETWAPIWSQLEYVDFNGNRIECDKKLQWILKYGFPNHYPGKCGSPLKLRNKYLDKINIADLE